MVQFTIPQRKAFVRMLEQIQEKLTSRYGYWNEDRKTEQERLRKKHKIAELQKKVDSVQGVIDKELEVFDEKREQEKCSMLKDVALAIADIWSCESAKEAKEMVAKFVKVEFPDA